MKKKIITLGLSLVMSITLLTACNKKEIGVKEDKVSIGMITDVGGINDGSFNESTWKGLKKAEKDLGVEVSYLESTKDSDFEPNIETFIDQEVDLILAVGYSQTEAIKEAAENYPDRNFAIIDGEFGDEEIPSNVKNIMFKEQEGSFLAGVLAASMSDNKSVGFIGGMESPVVDRYKYGYLAGVYTYAKDEGKDMNTMSSYANSFTDVAKGKAIAQQMIKDGADIIFHAAGPVGNGMFEALKESNLLGIGVDTDQSSIDPDTVMTSAIKKLDTVSYNVAKEVNNDNFKGGVTEINTLSNDGVGIAKVNNKVTEDHIKTLEKYSEKVKNGEIKVPATSEEFIEFKKSLK